MATAHDTILLILDEGSFLFSFVHAALGLQGNEMLVDFSLRSSITVEPGMSFNLFHSNSFGRIRLDQTNEKVKEILSGFVTFGLHGLSGVQD